MANEFKIKNGYLSEGNSQITGSLNVSAGITGSLFGTSSYAVQALSASYATTASYVQNAQSASYVQNAQTASYVLNAQTASYVLNAVSASYATQALSASYAANGGVTKILAGANVNLSPISGLGDVTITSFGTNLYNTATGSYGSFYDTGSVLAASTTVIYSMSLNTTDISNGVFVSASGGNNTRIKFTNAGVYNIQFSSQFSNTDNTNQDVVVWVRKNGTDVPDSSGVIGVPPFKAGSNGQVIASWNYYLNLSAGDYIQLCWHVEQANVITLETIPAGVGPTHPRTPSTILTAQRVDTFLSNTGSFSGSFTGTFTGSLLGTASHAATASYVGPTLTQDLTLNGNFTVNGTASYTYVTASQLDVGTNFISVNVGEPAERFGGLIVYDSGSLSHLATASLAWDSLNNHWVYQNASGSTYSGGMLMSGPRNTGSLGDEPSLTRWFIARSDGGDHLNDTQIYSSASIHIVTGSLTITSGVTGSLLGTASYATQALSASYALNATTANTASYVLNAVSASYVLNAVSASYVLNAVSSSYALSASFATSTTAVAGTTNYVPKFASSTTLGNSVMYDDGTNIGIGTTSPSYKLDVSGSTRFDGNSLITGSLTISGSTQTLDITPLSSYLYSIGTGANPYAYVRAVNYISPVNAVFLGTQNTYVGAGGEYTIGIFQTTRNVSIQNGGTFTDAGYRLDINGTTRVQNHLFQSTGFSLINLGNTLNLRSNLAGGSGYVIDAQSYNTLTGTNVEQGFGAYTGTYAPTSISGTPSFNALKLTPTINQTGGANGITRGLYINPTLTSATDFRAIETTSGSVIFSGGNVGIGTSTPNTKLDVNGNTIITGSLTVTGGITGSLLGTASYATQALSASWAPGGGSTFPYTGSALITGSLGITGSLDVSGSLDTGNRYLYSQTGQSLNWDSRTLSTPDSTTAIDWSDNTTLNSNVYQRDFKSTTTQNTVSNTLNNAFSSYLGDVIEVDGNYTFMDGTVNDGMLVYLDTDATWYPVNQNNTTATKMIGIACNVSGATGFILLEGHVVIDDSGAGGPTISGADHGLPIYIEDSTTIGRMSTTLPTTTGGNHVIRVLGHCYWNNIGTSSQWMMKFRPSNDWITI